MTEKPSVVVVGAGVIGITSAYYLAKQGHKVTVLEKNEACADYGTASYQNGGLLCYGYLPPAETLT